MGRPSKHTVEYFSHDADASEGKTLSILFNHFGHEGISAWWLLLERISRTRNHVISTRNSEDMEFLAAKMHFKPDRLKEILTKMAELEAIDPPLFERGLIWSQNLVDRLESVYKSRKQTPPTRPSLSVPETTAAARDGGLSGKETGLSVPETPQSKLKETKLKESKEENKGNIFSLFEKTFKEMAPSGCTQEMSLAEKEYPEKWIYDAFEIAGAKGKHTWPYVLGILKTWLKEGRVAKEGIGGKVGRPDKTDGWKDWAEFASPGDAPESLRQQAREA